MLCKTIMLDLILVYIWDNKLIHSVPYNKIWGWSKLKATADRHNKINVANMVGFAFENEENIVGKGVN